MRAGPATNFVLFDADVRAGIPEDVTVEDVLTSAPEYLARRLSIPRREAMDFKAALIRTRRPPK